MARRLFRGAGCVAVGCGEGGRAVVVCVVAEMARRASGFVLAIGAHRPPAKLEGDSNEKQVDESADHGGQYNIGARFALSCRP